MMTSARTPGSIRSITVARPRLARPSASRALADVAGSWITVSARAAVSVTAWRVCSAASAAARFARSMKLMARSSPSGLLDRDPLDDVGDVLALVDGLLQEGVDLLPADHLERFGTTGE